MITSFLCANGYIIRVPFRKKLNGNYCGSTVFLYNIYTKSVILANSGGRVQSLVLRSAKSFTGPSDRTLQSSPFKLEQNIK